MKPEPLTRDEVKSVIEGKARTRRVPMFIHFWVHPDQFGDRRQAVIDLLGRYRLAFWFFCLFERHWSLRGMTGALLDYLDTYWRPGEGRCMLTAGNGINGDCTLPSIEAFLDEAWVYGAQKAGE